MQQSDADAFRNVAPATVVLPAATNRVQQKP